MISGWAFCNFICERFDFYQKREQKRTAAYYLRRKITVLIWQGHKDLLHLLPYRGANQGVAAVQPAASRCPPDICI